MQLVEVPLTVFQRDLDIDDPAFPTTNLAGKSQTGVTTLKTQVENEYTWRQPQSPLARTSRTCTPIFAAW